jgi:hypothetical protein
MWIWALEHIVDPASQVLDRRAQGPVRGPEVGGLRPEFQAVSVPLLGTREADRMRVV